MRLPKWFEKAGAQPLPAPRAATLTGEIANITTPDELDDFLRGGGIGSAGIAVTETRSLGVAPVYASVRILAGAVANMPLHIKRRVDERTREDVPDHPTWAILRRRPNRWMKPNQFKRMMQTMVLLRGNAYALKVRRPTTGQLQELWPLNPGRMKVQQMPDMSLAYEYRRLDGSTVTFPQRDIMHLMGLTLDGVEGVSVLTYARESIGTALATEAHGNRTFANGASLGKAFKYPGKLSEEAFERLKESLAQYEGPENAGKTIILEEGAEIGEVSMTMEDAQFIDTRKFTRGDIAMFFGVPPHMIGDTEKSTSWGSGIEQQSIGFVTYTLEDWLTMWEDAINADLIGMESPDIYARFNRKALVRGDIKTRTEAMTKRLQWGVTSPNEERALEDMNPRDDGDVYYDPPNTAGNTEADDEPEETTQG